MEEAIAPPMVELPPRRSPDDLLQLSQERLQEHARYLTTVYHSDQYLGGEWIKMWNELSEIHEDNPGQLDGAALQAYQKRRKIPLVLARIGRAIGFPGLNRKATNIAYQIREDVYEGQQKPHNNQRTKDIMETELTTSSWSSIAPEGHKEETKRLPTGITVGDVWNRFAESVEPGTTYIGELLFQEKGPESVIIAIYDAITCHQKGLTSYQNFSESSNHLDDLPMLREDLQEKYFQPT